MSQGINSLAHSGSPLKSYFHKAKVLHELKKQEINTDLAANED